MADIKTSEARSANMAAIKSKNTKPEVLIRKALYAKNFRYRLHDKSLPGKPDLVFKKYRAVIFINGCFWHRHNCYLFKWPQSRIDFWKTKIESNVVRDQQNIKKYSELGWKVLTIWECSLKGKFRLDFDELINETEAWIRTGKDNKSITCRSEGLL